MGMRIRQRRKQKPEEGQAGLSANTAAPYPQIYEQFLPVELLAMMGMDDAASEAAGNAPGQKELTAVILNGNIVGFQELIDDMQMPEVYRFINQTLAFSIPAVYENNGFVESFRDAGVSALFTGDMEDGLQAAIMICEEVVKGADGNRYRNYAIGLCRGSVMAGVVGNGRKRCVLTLSAHMELSAFLQRTAPKYYTRILATAGYTEGVNGFDKKYNHRLLGYFYIRDMGCAEKVFDIFDGDETAVRNRKRKTKMLFEKGVGLFVRREFAQARGYFIEVLKADREDRAAREYVFLCDRYRGLPAREAAGADIFIETC